MTHWLPSRRQFLARAGAAGLAASALPFARAEEPDETPKGKADACIFLWLGGGACHIDTFDPKRRGDPKAKRAGSDYDPIPTAVPGVQVCEHLKETAKILDRLVLVRSLHHNVIDEHAAAVQRVHTGRPITESVLYPSVGSVVAYEKGPGSRGVPAYVVLGFPSVSRGPGFLGGKYGFVYLTETDVGPAGLTRPPDVDAVRQARREDLLAKLRDGQLSRHPGDKPLHEYATAAADGFRLAGPDFMTVFDLKTESAELRARYGGEFGQRCLLARRLVEAGVRFVEVGFTLTFINGTGWDTHNEGQRDQYKLIQELDQALATLVLDLEARRRLDRTLIVVATEFGRPPEFDARGGRGHQARAFSGVLGGGGLRTGRIVGATDELGKKVAERPVSIPDFHATIYAALGIDPGRELYADERPVPITDHGKPIRELFA